MYKKQLGIYREKEEEIKSAAFINQYRNKNIAEQAKKFGEDILKASQILSDADIKKGISEIFFHDFLSQYSNYNVYKSLKFGYYYPDLVVIDSQGNFVIDIEIDEPYVFDSKEPIHFDDVDAARDIYFTKCNFVVIRFCEEQIINCPEYCLHVINETVKNLLSLQESRNSKESIIYKHEMPAWDHETAFLLAYNHSRKNIDDLIKKVRKDYL